MWEMDEIKFSKNYPALYSQFLTTQPQRPNLSDRDIIFDLFKDNINAAFDVSKICPAIEITLTDGSVQIISNIDIVKIHGYYLDGSEVRFERQFVYCILSLATGQAGTLGIWDVTKSDWCFFYTDEGFCVTNVEYNVIKDSFLGTCEDYYPSSNAGGLSRFVVTSDRKYQNI